MSDDPATGATGGEQAAGAGDGPADGPGPTRAVEGPLDAVRESAKRRWFLTSVGAVLGLVVALGHWLGFVVGGSLVALPQRSSRRGLLAGVAFGLLAWLVFLTSLGTAGVLDTYVQMGPVLALSTITPIAGGLLGALLRGVV